jgi:hypothetical protein
VRQRKIIKDLENKGADTASARELLAQLETAQATQMAERDRIRRDLAG